MLPKFGLERKVLIMKNIKKVVLLLLIMLIGVTSKNVNALENSNNNIKIEKVKPAEKTIKFDESKAVSLKEITPGDKSSPLKEVNDNSLEIKKFENNNLMKYFTEKYNGQFKEQK